MEDLKLCLDKNVEENIKFISSKIIEKKTILFLGAGFSANFNFPLWKELLSSIIEKIEDEYQNNLSDNGAKELNNLKSMIHNKFDLSKILDNLKSWLKRNMVDKVDMLFRDVYIDELDIAKKKIDNERREILELINNNFDKIITTNYDNIFGWNELENPKQYIKNQINNIEELINKVYPIHGSIVIPIEEQVNSISKSNSNNIKKLTFVDTYESFINNWINENFMESFRELVKKLVDENYTFIFLGYSFEDQFVANSLAAFILRKTGPKIWENKNFFVLFNDYEKSNIKCDCCDKCEADIPNLVSSKYVKTYKEPVLDTETYGIHYIKFSEIFNSKESIDDLFIIIKKFFDCIKKIVKFEDLLNEINLIINNKIISKSKKFNCEEYFSDEKINDKFENKQELLFIIDFFSKKYDLLNSNNIYKEKYIDKFLKKLFNWMYENRLKFLSKDIRQFLGKSKLYIKLLKWGIELRNSNEEIIEWLGELV